MGPQYSQQKVFFICSEHVQTSKAVLFLSPKQYTTDDADVVFFASDRRNLKVTSGKWKEEDGPMGLLSQIPLLLASRLSQVHVFALDREY